MTIIQNAASPYTRHGHLVPGLSGEGWPDPEAVARCGGIGLCPACSADSIRIRASAGADTDPRLALATTMQLLDELVARCEAGGPLGRPDPTVNRLDPVIMLLGDVKEQISKIDPAMLGYAPAQTS